jgi:transcriptional regulator with XRE-family HTH domain
MTEHELSARVRLAREHLKISQKDLAEALGIHYRTFQDQERGKTVPSAIVLQHLTSLGINGQWLLTGEGSMHSEATSPTVEAPAVAIDQELHALVVDGILLIYKQENARLPPRDLGRLAARIHNDLIQTYADPDERKIGLKMALKQLQHALTTPITATTISKQQA